VSEKKRKVPKLEHFVSTRDYTGAITILEFNIATSKFDYDTQLWLGYTCFHLGDYKKSLEIYQNLLRESGEKHLEPIPRMQSSCKLQNRLLFHLSHKFNDEKRLMGYHQNLQDVIEDQLCLASIHYLRSHYQEAIDIYKKNSCREQFLAINVYVAMCYYKLDYYDVSQEVLSVYLQHFPDSGDRHKPQSLQPFPPLQWEAAESELSTILDRPNSAFRFGDDLLRHNLARLNLVIYYLRNDDIVSAYNLMKDVEPATPQQYFQLVGGSASECDTIPGRQCMASCFFLLKQFDDVLIYLNSIKGYFYNDDTFNFNYGEAKVAIGAFEEAEEILLLIQSDRLKNEYPYLSHLARCYIINKKPRLAWELYLKMETSSESFSLLQLIANDCYKMGHYLYSAKAFDVLERLDPNPDYWEGKRGACIGVVQQVISGDEQKEALRDVITLLRNTSNPQVEYIIRIIKKFAKDNRLGF
ncbi:hypothetical protein BC829DRAFT_381757, partial [Chytridium lagenaria]